MRSKIAPTIDDPQRLLDSLAATEQSTRLTMVDNPLALAINVREEKSGRLKVGEGASQRRLESKRRLELQYEMSALGAVKGELITLLEVLIDLKSKSDAERDLPSVSENIVQLEAEVAMRLRSVDDSVRPIKFLFDSYEPRCVCSSEASQKPLCADILVRWTSLCR